MSFQIEVIERLFVFQRISQLWVGQQHFHIYSESWNYSGHVGVFFSSHSWAVNWIWFSQIYFFSSFSPLVLSEGTNSMPLLCTCDRNLPRLNNFWRVERERQALFFLVLAKVSVNWEEVWKSADVQIFLAWHARNDWMLRRAHLNNWILDSDRVSREIYLAEFLWQEASFVLTDI